jgi:hypothetical protein
LCGTRLAVVDYIAANGVHYKLRCLACRRLSRTALPQRLLDYAAKAQAPAVRSASASVPGFLCEHCDGAGVETHNSAPRSPFHDYKAWPTVQLCLACDALWHEVMRAGA